MSDNLIDFTDPTPVVGSQGFEVALQNFLCPRMIVLEEFSDELPRNLRMEPLPEGHSAPCWPDARLQETPVQSGQLLGPSASRGPTSGQLVTLRAAGVPFCPSRIITPASWSSAPCGAAAQTCHHPSLDHPHISSETLAAPPFSSQVSRLWRDGPGFVGDPSHHLFFSLAASRHLHQRPA